MTDMTKRRDQQAKNHVDSLTTELVHSFPFTHIEHAYCKGFDDGKTEMQAHQAAIINDLKDMGNNKFDAIQRLTKERNSLKAQLDVAVKAMKNELKNVDECGCGHEEGNGLCYLHEALEQIQKMRGGG